MLFSLLVYLIILDISKFSSFSKTDTPLIAGLIAQIGNPALIWDLRGNLLENGSLIAQYYLEHGFDF
jgi:hypothetical protein